MRAKSLIRKRGRINGVRHHTTRGEIILDGHNCYWKLALYVIKKAPAGEVFPDCVPGYWKSVYDAHGRHSERRDIRATLNDLATISDAEVEAAILALDSLTECEMVRGVWYWCRRKKPTGVIPNAAFILENYGAPEIREIAQLAIEHFKLTTGGRPNTKKLDVEFAAFLAQEFQKQTGTRPTTITDRDTPFMRFAVSQFAALGRQGREMTKILREGIRKGLNKPKRIYRLDREKNIQSSIYQSWPYRGK